MLMFLFDMQKDSLILLITTLNNSVFQEFTNTMNIFTTTTSTTSMSPKENVTLNYKLFTGVSGGVGVLLIVTISITAALVIR